MLEKNKLWIKINNFDLWPIYISYAPIVAYATFNAIRLRSTFYFFLANPGIETGGMIIESKYDILKQIPTKYIPKGDLIKSPLTKKKVQDTLKKNLINYPFVIKPNYGERGRLVEQINNEKELKNYLSKTKKINSDFILQEYINGPLEVGIFYQRMPTEKKGKITSFIVKEMLHVVGDGKSTVKTLMNQNTYTKIQLDEHPERFVFIINKIPKNKEIFLVAPIASHNRGTVFIDYYKHINEKLTNLIDTISKQVKGFYYGRYDIRVESIEELYKGNFKIIELNGAKGEPTHIYDRKHPISKAYKDLFWHWKQMYKISKLNHEKGIPYPKFKEGYKAFKEFKELKRKI